MTDLERRRMTPPGWTPAWPGQRPPVGPGNTLGLRHGAWSRALVVPAAEAIVAALLPTLPSYLHETRYRPALHAYAVCLARIERVEQYLEDQAVTGVPAELDADGSVKAATSLLGRLEGAADRHRSSLGLTPMSAARLGKDVAQTVSLTQLWQQMDDQDAQEPAQTPISGPDASRAAQ